MFRSKKRRPALFRITLLVALSLLLCVSFVRTSQQATAAAASTINFQARLLTSAGAIVPDGNYNVEFKLYNTCTVVAASGGCTTFSGNVWTETRTLTNRVRVVNGYMTVNLGSVTAFGAINWDQDLWMTMNIGETTTSPTWNGEMTPALKLTAVPYAFRAGSLANTNGANNSTLGWALQTASNSILLPNEAGTLCIQGSSNCGFLTTGSGSGYVQLQGSTPGTPQTGNLNISGTGIFGTALQSPSVVTTSLTSSAGLSIGTTGSTSITIGQASIDLTNNSRMFNSSRVYVGTTSALSGVTGALSVVPLTTSTYGLVVRGLASQANDMLQIQDSTGACLWRVAPNGTTGSCDNVNAVGGTGTTAMKSGDVSGTGSGTSGAVTVRSGNNTNGNTGLVTIKSGNATAGGGSGQVQLYSGTAPSNANTGAVNIFTSDAFGGSAASGVVTLNSGNVTSGSGASGAVTIDTGSSTGTTGALNLGSTNASSINIGDGATARTLNIGNTTGATALNLRAGTGNINLLTNSASAKIIAKSQTNAVTAFQVQNTGGTTVLNVDTSNARVGINNVAPAYDLDVTGEINASSQIRVGGIVVCTSSGCTPSGGSGVTLQGSTPGTAQTGNFNITGTGIAGILQAASFDTASAGTLSLGGTNATAVTIGQNLTLTSGKTLTIQGSSLFKPSSDSITAFQIQPSASTTPVLNADTTNSRIGINNAAPVFTLDVTGTINTTGSLNVGSIAVCDAIGTTGCIAKSGSGYYIHNQTTVQASNLYVQAATTGTVAATFQAFNGGAGDIADFLNGTGTTVASISSVGSTLFKPSTNSTSAFQVQPSGSTTPVLNVDTTNSRVGIGTATPSRTLHILTSDAATTTPMLLVEQASTGDSTIEIKSPGKSYIIGQDTSDSGKFKISSSTASQGIATLGNSTAGIADTGGANTVIASRFVAAGSGNVTSMSVYANVLDGSTFNRTYSLAIYADSVGLPSRPGALITGGGTSTIAVGWNTIPISATLTSGTTYWLVYWTKGDNSPNYFTGGTESLCYKTSVAFTGTWPSTSQAATPTGCTGNSLSIYATYTPAGAYDSFNKSLFSLGDTGQAVFQNSTDSATAFQVQNASASTLFSIDSTNSRVVIGNGTTGAATPTLLLLNSGSSGDPAGSAATQGAMYYNATNNKFRCYENSAWKDCISGFNTITKTADQAATASSTTFQNDNKLFFPMAVSTSYVFDAWIPIDNSNATATGKFTFTVPTGATLNLMTTTPGATSATTNVICNITASAQVCPLSAFSSATNFVQVRGYVKNSTTAGNVQLQFAQNTSTAVSFPVVKAGGTISWHTTN